MCNNCVKLLVNKQDQRKWNEQKLDWSLHPTEGKVYEYYHSEGSQKALVKSNELPKGIRHCVCGHQIDINYPVYNDKTNLCYILGSVCICRYKKNDKSTRGAFTGNEVMEQQMKVLHSYHCDVCNKTIAIEQKIKHEETKKHKKNYLIQNYRLCRKCKEYTIEITKPSYYHTCRMCYIFKKKE